MALRQSTCGRNFKSARHFDHVDLWCKPRPIVVGIDVFAINRETGKLIWENQLPIAVDAVYSIGSNVYIPYGPSLYVLNQSDGSKSTVKAISEAGEIQRLVRDGGQAIAIARDYVTVFSLLGQSP